LPANSATGRRRRRVGRVASREAVRQRAGAQHARFLDEFRRRLDALVGGRVFRERQVDVVFLA